MNNFDVSGVLRTYSERARYCRTKTQLQNLIRELKSEFNYKEIQKLYVDEDIKERIADAMQTK